MSEHPAWRKFIEFLEADGMSFDDVKDCGEAERSEVISSVKGLTAVQRAHVSAQWKHKMAEKAGTIAVDPATKSKHSVKYGEGHVPATPATASATAEFADPRSMEELEQVYKKLHEEAEAPDVNSRCLLPLDKAKKFIDEMSARLLLEQQEGSSSKKFTDPLFPPVITSLNRLPADEYPEQSVSGADRVEWARPSELHPDEAALFVNPPSADAVCQGGIGDCYLVSQVASFAESTVSGGAEALFYPATLNPAGIMGVRLWHPILEEWRMCIIDDIVPHNHKRPIDIASEVPHEFWSTLLQRAFAKINGSYQELWAGMSHVGEIGVLLVGGGLVINCSKTVDEHWAAIKGYLDKRGIITTGSGSVDADGNYTTVSREEGLVQGHAYSIVRYAEDPDNNLRLVCLRNPWGGTEWNGAWSDADDNWNKYPHMKKICMHAEEDDGLFWIDVETQFRKFGGVRAYLPPGESPLPTDEFMPPNYTWAFKGGALKTRINMDSIKGALSHSQEVKPDGGMLGGSYSMSNSPQMRVVVKEPTTLRFRVDRSGPAATGTLQRVTEKNLGGRCLRSERPDDDEQGADEETGIGKRVVKEVLSTSFIDWAPDVELQPGAYNITTFVQREFQNPVKFEVKADKDVTMTEVETIPYAQCLSKFTAENSGEMFRDADATTHQYLMDVMKPGRVLIEVNVKDFDPFKNPENAHITVYLLLVY